MSIYPEIPCNKTKNIDRDKDGNSIPEKSYTVRKFGIAGVVFEEEWYEIPTEKTIKAFDINGAEVPDLAKTEPIEKGI